jgi:hypothetical protein
MDEGEHSSSKRSPKPSTILTLHRLTDHTSNKFKYNHYFTRPTRSRSPLRSPTLHPLPSSNNPRRSLFLYRFPLATHTTIRKELVMFRSRRVICLARISALKPSPSRSTYHLHIYDTRTISPRRSSYTQQSRSPSLSR